MENQKSSSGFVLQSSEFSSHAARESVISISNFPLPPTISHFAAPPTTPFLAKSSASSAPEKSKGRLETEKKRYDIGNGDESVSDFAPTSFFVEDVFQGEASSDSASDFTVSTGILASPRNSSFSINDSPPPTASTCTAATTLNSLDLSSPLSSPSMTRTHKAHYEHLHTGTPSSSFSNYSPTAGNFPRQRSHIRPHSHQFDIDIVIPSPGLHLPGGPYGYTDTATEIAKATAAAASTPSGERPPSPLLPPLPSRSSLLKPAGRVKMFGLSGSNAFGYVPDQVKVGPMRRTEVEKTVAYEDVIARVPPRTQDVWKEETVDKEELFLPPPVPSKIPKPAIPPKSPHRASITRPLVAGKPAEKGAQSFQIQPDSLSEAEAADKSEAGGKAIPVPSQSVHQPGQNNHGTLLDIIAGLRNVEDEDDSADDVTTAATVRPATPKRLPKHEDSGVAFSMDEVPEDDGTGISHHNRGSIVSLASAVIASPTMSESSMSIKRKENAEASATAERARGLIASLRQHADALVQKERKFTATIQEIRRFISLPPPETAGVNAGSHLHYAHRLLRKSQLREAELLAEEVELERALTECVAELLEFRMTIGLGEKGHDASDCEGCFKLEELEMRKASKKIGKMEGKRSAEQNLVSEEEDGGVVGCMMWRTNDGEQENQMKQKLIIGNENNIQVDLKEYKKDVGEEVKEKLGEMKTYATIAKKHIEDIKRKSVVKAQDPDASVYSAILEASPTKDTDILETKSLVERDIHEGDTDDVDEDEEWLYEGVYANVGRAITTGKELPDYKNAPPAGKEKKIPEGDQLRRTDQGVYSFLDQAPKRSVSPTPLSTKGPSRSIPSLRKGRPLPQQLTRIRPAYEIIGTDDQAPRVSDNHELPKRFHFRNMIQRSQFNRMSRGTGASSPGPKREDGMIFRLPKNKAKEQQDKKSLVSNDDDKTSKKSSGKQVSMVKKMAGAMESQRSSEDSNRTMVGSTFKSSGPDGQAMPFTMAPPRI